MEEWIFKIWFCSILSTFGGGSDLKSLYIAVGKSPAKQ